MQAEDCIKSRRSVRKYDQREVSDAVLAEIVDLARFAPSWKNSQVIRYHVVKNPQKKAFLAEHCVMGFSFNAKTIQRCSALVIVTAVHGICGYEPDGSYSTPKGDRWEMFDAGVASQTFCLAAHSKGIGSVILGIFDEEALHQAMGLPDNEQVMSLIALGYPLEPEKAAPPRKEVRELLEIME